jgi:hypothetical protein
MFCHPSRLEDFRRKWQKIYTDRKDAEVDAASYDMIIEPTRKAEAEREAVHTNQEI